MVRCVPSGRSAARSDAAPSVVALNQASRPSRDQATPSSEFHSAVRPNTRPWRSTMTTHPRVSGGTGFSTKATHSPDGATRTQPSCPLDS